MLASLNDRQITYFALAVSLGFIILGMVIFLQNIAHAETGTGWLAMGYVITCFFLFFVLRLRMLVLTILCVSAAFALQTYAYKKFEWRGEYIQNAQAGEPFMAEAYIDHYPTYEEQIKARIFKEPNWVDFTNQCLWPLSKSMKPDVRCSNPNLVSTYYNIDLSGALIAQFDKMKETARRIEAGDLKTKAELQQCIADKQCALVPLLPPNVDATKIAPTSVEYMAIRKAFWSVMNDNRIRPEVCEYMLLCKAMVQLNLLDAADPDPR